MEREKVGEKDLRKIRTGYLSNIVKGKRKLQKKKKNRKAKKKRKEMN